MNFIDVSYIDDKVCDEYIKYFESGIPQLMHGSVYSDGVENIDKNKKSTIELQYDFIPEHLKKMYLQQLDKSIDQYIKAYPEVDSLAYFGPGEFQVQKYGPNDGFPTWHWERGKNSRTYYRCLVFTTYLNDVDDGGETEFKYQDIKIKPKKGKTVIFPADWTHTHRGNIVKSGNKYIITGWLVNYLKY